MKNSAIFWAQTEYGSWIPAWLLQMWRSGPGCALGFWAAVVAWRLFSSPSALQWVDVRVRVRIRCLRFSIADSRSLFGTCRAKRTCRWHPRCLHVLLVFWTRGPYGWLRYKFLLKKNLGFFWSTFAQRPCRGAEWTWVSVVPGKKDSMRVGSSGMVGSVCTCLLYVFFHCDLVVQNVNSNTTNFCLKDRGGVGREGFPWLPNVADGCWCFECWGLQILNKPDIPSL